MSASTRIAWTEATWNPWYGCTKVSPGCDHCYMFRDMTRYGRDPETVTRSRTTFAAPLRWWEPRRIFTCSWSDFFHKAADAWRPEAWDIIRATPHHTYQILTKRPGRIARHLPPDWGEGYPNVWLGVSVESQAQVRRIEVLAAIPATVRWLSCEPLLGPVTLRALEHIGWVVVGGESGPDGERRDMDLAWAEDIQAQCQHYAVPFFFKQRSAVRSEDVTGVPESLLVREYPAQWEGVGGRT